MRHHRQPPRLSRSYHHHYGFVIGSSLSPPARTRTSTSSLRAQEHTTITSSFESLTIDSAASGPALACFDGHALHALLVLGALFRSRWERLPPLDCPTSVFAADLDARLWGALTGGFPSISPWHSTCFLLLETLTESDSPRQRKNGVQSVDGHDSTTLASIIKVAVVIYRQMLQNTIHGSGAFSLVRFLWASGDHLDLSSNSCASGNRALSLSRSLSPRFLVGLNTLPRHFGTTLASRKLVILRSRSQRALRSLGVLDLLDLLSLGGRGTLGEYWTFFVCIDRPQAQSL
ncbi:hypothetical protein FB451DRAFT_1399358 [Mycena latifolia]|nr:hypothetical protein FB451DRAFT_1399358 [Mycena latifolia]